MKSSSNRQNDTLNTLKFYQLNNSQLCTFFFVEKSCERFTDFCGEKVIVSVHVSLLHATS